MVDLKFKCDRALWGAQSILSACLFIKYLSTILVTGNQTFLTAGGNKKTKQKNKMTQSGISSTILLENNFEIFRKLST